MRVYDYLNGILGALGVGEDNGVPTPAWRIEEYLEAIYEAIKAGGGGGGADLTAFLAPQFSSSTSYSAGDYVVKSGALYKFTEDHAAGAWTGTDAEQTLTSVELEALYAALSNYAKVDGSYSTLTAGNAEQLVSTVGVEDSAPYLFRTTGGSADVGDRVKLSKITGGTVAWNQLVKNGNFDGTTNWSYSAATLSASNNILTVTKDAGKGEGVGYARQSSFTFNIGHKYFARVDYKAASGDSLTLFSNKTDAGMTQITGISDENWHTVQKIFNVASAPSVPAILWINTVTTDDTRSVQFRNYNIIDLTAMFGSTIADYLYTLESGTAGAGVSKLKSWGFCQAPYYAYDAGSLLSVKTSAHKEIGFNQWDEQWEEGAISSSTGNNTSATGRIRSKNKIPVLPSTVYYFHSPFTNANQCTLYFYDINEAYLGVASQQNAYEGTFTTPSDAWYMRFNTGANSGATYQNNICINLHWDGERDGEYEPYEANTYPLDSDLELRGIPKLDANNNLYYDGDTYASDGTVGRNIVELEVTHCSSVSTASTGVKYASVALADNAVAESATNNFLSNQYQFATSAPSTSGWFRINVGNLYIFDNRFTDTETADTILASEKPRFIYKKTTPTTESADPFQETQICDDFGTEEFIDSRTVPMPVGANALYQANLRAKLEMAPDSPSGDGDYIVRQTDGLNEYVLLEKELPTLPSTDGTYTLKCTVASGTATLSWVADA